MPGRSLHNNFCLTHPMKSVTHDPSTERRNGLGSFSVGEVEMTLFRHVSRSALGSGSAGCGIRRRVRSLTGAAIVCAALLVTLRLSAASGQTCAGDCNGDGQVSTDEMIVGANLVLGTLDLRSCPAADAGGDGVASIGEAIAAVRGSLGGCGNARTAGPRSAGVPAQIELGVVTGSAGAQVTFDATLHDMGNVVAGTQNDIAFDPLTPIVECVENLAINKSVSVGFQPTGCAVGVNCTGVRVIVLSLFDVDPIPDGSVLYTCRVAIDFTAPDGTYPLVSSAEGAGTPEGA